MKLDETNAKFAVVRRAFHGGRAVSFHTSAEAAERAAKRHQSPACACGGCAVALTIDEYNALPGYAPDMNYWQLCR